MATHVSIKTNQWGKIGELARDIKLSHTLFAMPFALLATFLAAGVDGQLPRMGMLGLVVICMVMGRTCAMAINRWADAALDVYNPRTVTRAIPGGRLTKKYMLASAIVSGAGLLLGAAGFWWLYQNPYPLIFAPGVLAWFVLYSYAKRFTWLCHVVLGVALALSPLAAALAVNPGYLALSGAYLLAGMVLCWVAGFDVIYALQDLESDRKTGVFSLPVRLGAERALWVSRILHLVSVLLLGWLWWDSPLLEIGFATATALVAGLLVVEHVLVWGAKTNQIHAAFFTVNGVISLALGGLGILDIVRVVG